MTDYVYLGSTPGDEDCVQVSSKGAYLPAMRRECAVYLHQLQRMFPEAHFKVKRFDHDFGVYYEVVAVFDADDEEEAQAAYRVDDEAPTNWDEEALVELTKQKTISPRG